MTITAKNLFLDQNHLDFEEIPAGKYVVLSFADGGVGMAPEEIRKIFAPFYTTKVMGRSGTGLGMAVHRELRRNPMRNTG